MNQHSHWDAYWKEGFLTSFGSTFKSNYVGSYKSHWQDIFSQLQNNANVLDIATGNASLPLLGLEVNDRLNKAIKFTASDLADLDKALIRKQLPPAARPLFDEIDLYPKTDSASLPFENDVFDCVISQYGFEYSDRSKTLYQIHRVLKSNGKVFLLMHSTDSVILQRNQKTILCIDALLAANGVIECLTSLVKAMGDIITKAQLAELAQNKKTEKLRKKLNKMMAELEQSYDIGFADTNINFLVSSLFRDQLLSPVTEKIGYIRSFVVTSKSLKERLMDLQMAAVSADEFNTLIDESSSLGLNTINKKQFIDPKEGLLGWVWELEKVA